MNRKIFVLIGIYIAAILLFARMRPEQADWSPSYAPQRSLPFAAEVLYNELETIRTEKISLSGRPVYNVTQSPVDDQTIYFFLNDAFYPGELDLEFLLKYVDAGNTVMIASEGISSDLLDTLNLDTEYEYLSSAIPAEWFYDENVHLSLDGIPDKSWSAAVNYGYQWFIAEDSSTTKILGRFNGQHPNFVECRYGDGTIFLHSFPLIFTNYHMLHVRNHEYVSSALSQIPSHREWRWDTYYIDPQNKASSPLTALNRHASFRWAYWLGLLGLLIFIVFTARRRQRMIPVLKPKRNTTLDFIRTIGDLYFARGDHADLVRKKIANLQWQIRKLYRMEIKEFSPEESLSLAERSGLETDDIRKVFTQVRQLREMKSVSVETLFAFQKNMDKLSGKKTQA